MWKTAYFCVECKGEVSYYTRMHSYGRCPLCEYKGTHAGTIMDTKEVAYKRVRINPRYKFWKPQFKRVWAESSK